MVQFKYQNGNSVKNGQITIIHASFPIEADIHASGWSFHIIVIIMVRQSRQSGVV